MRRYESVYIASTLISEEELKSLAEKVEGIITQDNGLILRHTRWGKNRLAYDIKVHGTRHDYGCYFYVNYLAPPETVAELERNLKIDERFLRYLTVKLEERPNIEELKARAAEEPEETRPKFAPEEPETPAEEGEEGSAPEEEAVEEAAPGEAEAETVEEAPGEGEGDQSADESVEEPVEKPEAE